MTYRSLQTRLQMNHDEQVWLMCRLRHVTVCADTLHSCVQRHHYHKANENEALYERFRYEAAVNKLNERETICVRNYIEALWKAYIQERALPKFVCRNLVESDFTYHRVDIRSFMRQDITIAPHSIVKASTFYAYRHHLYIYLYLKESGNNRHQIDIKRK